MLPYISTEYGNPSSDHCFGTPSREAVAAARASVAAMLGCDPGEVVFCGCGSEADNHALRGAVALKRGGLPQGAKPHVIASAIEHVAISACLDQMAKDGETGSGTAMATSSSDQGHTGLACHTRFAFHTGDG